MCSSIPEQSSVASIKERVKSNLRTAHTSKHWSKRDKDRQHPAIQILGARELLIFLKITLKSEGNYWKPWENTQKQKWHLSGMAIHVEFLGYFMRL